MTIKMAYEVIILYHLHMPLYFTGTFTEYLPFTDPTGFIYVYENLLFSRKANHPSRLSRQSLPAQREQHSWEETEHPAQQAPGHPHALLSTHGYC